MKAKLPISTLVIPLTMSLVFANPTFANNTEENPQAAQETGIGFGAGLVAGSLIAGPVGAVPGAIIGALIGKNVNSEKEIQNFNESTKELEANLLESSSKIDTLKNLNLQQGDALVDAHTSIETLRTNNQQLKAQALNFDVQFRTNSIDIEKQYQQHLNHLAEALNNKPTITIEIAGYADRVGDETHNMQLSKQRALHVKEYLVQQGVRESRITTLAHGENQPLSPEESLENNFFDRRVNIYLQGIEVADEKKETGAELSVAAN